MIDENKTHLMAKKKALSWESASENSWPFLTAVMPLLHIFPEGWS